MVIRIGGRLPLIVHEEIFVFIDEGRAIAVDYQLAAKLALERVSVYPNGIGCLVMIPATAQPPNELVRRAIKESLEKATPHLRGMCWIVEGSGFRAATLRAALAGLRLLLAAPYPTSVEKDLVEGLQWMLKRLRPAAGPSQLISTVSSVANARESLFGRS
jgi:hypothetical protein